MGSGSPLATVVRVHIHIRRACTSACTVKKANVIKGRKKLSLRDASRNPFAMPFAFRSSQIGSVWALAGSHIKMLRRDRGSHH